jgi:hypothetical protein
MLSFFHESAATVAISLFIIEVSRLHSDTPYLVVLLWTSDRSDTEISTCQQQSQETDVHVPGGIRTHNPSKRAVADPRLSETAEIGIKLLRLP